MSERKTQLLRTRDRLRPAMNTEFDEDIVHMRFDGTHCMTQLSCLAQK